MVQGEATTEIARPVETVFGFVVTEFFANYPRWSPEVTLLEPLDDAPLEVGAQAHQVRVDHGRRSDTVVQVVSLEPGRHVAFASRGSLAFTSTFEFSDQARSTALTFRFELVELKLYMRPFESFIRRAIQDGAERTVANIRDLIESER